MGKGPDLPVLLVFLSFLFWSWVFGFVGALLAIPATLFVKTLLQGRQETHFLVVLLSGPVDGASPATLPEAGQDQRNTAEEPGGSPDASRATSTVESRREDRVTAMETFSEQQARNDIGDMRSQVALLKCRGKAAKDQGERGRAAQSRKHHHRLLG